MGKSLQEQLLKSGLATRKQASKANKAIAHQQKRARQGASVQSEAAQAVQEAEQARREQAKMLNRKRQAKAEKQARRAEIRQLIEPNRIAARGDVPFHYTDGHRVTTLNLRDAERQALIGGTLAIVRLGQKIDLVPRQVAEKIRERDPALVVFAASTDASNEAVDQDYADYQVPDDLMW